jgi:hypothetical protein
MREFELFRCADRRHRVCIESQFLLFDAFDVRPKYPNSKFKPSRKEIECKFI